MKNLINSEQDIINLCNRVNGVKSAPMTAMEKKASDIIEDLKNNSKLTLSETLQFLKVIEKRVNILIVLEDLEKEFKGNE
jgi:hypothetical protein